MNAFIADGASCFLGRHIAVVATLLLVSLAGCQDIGSSVSGYEWPRSTPEEQQMASATLNELSDRISAGEYGQIHSLLIVRHGYLVHERYFGSYTREDLHPVYSVTKSVTSLLIGLGIDQQKIAGTSASLLGFFPQYPSIANMDSSKARMTLDDVLTMRAGYRWDEWSTSYADPTNPVNRLTNSPDWIKFVLDLPMSDTPGTRFTYNSGCSILLAGVLMSSTGEKAHEFARHHLFTPLGIAQFEWSVGPNAVANAGWGLRMRPRDMAVVGNMVLNNGLWLGKRIVSEHWIQAATTRRTQGSGVYGYGYQWWLRALDSLRSGSPSPTDVRFAWGWGGQFIFIIAKFDLVVVTTAGNYGGPDDQPIVFLYDYILRAVRTAS